MELVAELKECPHCKVDARLMNSIVQEEVAKGNMGKGLTPNTEVKIISNVDAKKPPIIGGRIPSARTFKDICMKCGREYVWRIEKGHVTMPSRPGMMPLFE